jgi:hypothetical protein
VGFFVAGNVEMRIAVEARSDGTDDCEEKDRARTNGGGRVFGWRENGKMWDTVVRKAGKKEERHMTSTGAMTGHGRDKGGNRHMKEFYYSVSIDNSFCKDGRRFELVSERGRRIYLQRFCQRR